MGWTSAKVDDESEDEQADYGDNLDTRKDEFGFTIYGDGEYIEANHKYKNKRYPCRHIDPLSSIPELNDNRRR